MEVSLLNRDVAPLNSDPEASLGYDSSDITHLLPFQQESPGDLQHELWLGGGRTWDITSDEWPGLRRQVNYMRAYTLWNLRMHAKSITPWTLKTLDGLWDRFPAELICSIYSLLHPIDLYHAVCSTKRLQRFLLDKKSSFIWKQCFLNYPDIPFYPDDFSAPRWASLIFGPATCDGCGMSDFFGEYVLRRRNCETCDSYHSKNTHVLSDAIRPIIGEFRDQRNDIWKMATKIQQHIVLSFPKYGFYSYYSLNHILELAENMRVHLLEIKLGAPDSRLKYNAFVNATKVRARKHEQHAETCRSWVDNIEKQRHTVLMNSLPAFHKMAERALRKRGYNTMDVKTAISSFFTVIGHEYVHRSAVSDPWLNKSKVPKYMPILEGFVDEARRKRLILPRKKRVDVCYNQIIKKLLSPREMRSAPFADITYKFGYFRDYINNSQDKVGELDYEIAEPEIRRFLETYLTRKRHQFFKLFQDKHLLSEKAYEDSDVDQALKLAIAVFECCGKRFIGFDEARTHLCGIDKLHMQDVGDDSFRFCFSDAGFRTLENIVKILGLGSESLKSLTQGNLDALKKRFVCKICKISSHGGPRGLLVLTWRQCLDHESYRSDPHTPVFDVLSEALTSHLLARDVDHPKLTNRVWSCCYCKPSRCLWRNEAESIDHVTKSHDVANPIAKVDFKYIPTHRFHKRFLNFVGLDGDANHRCLRCSPTANKLWQRRDVYQHLRDKHHIQLADLVEGIDWEKIKAVEDESWILQAMSRDG